jgi:NAD(P)-dependent dehydrogenase (short-subunit alcohol dehydrogenase family)
MADFRLDDRVALITGGAGGIGLAVARRFAAAGARIAVADKKSDTAKQAAGELAKLGYRAIGIAGDVSKSADAEALVQGAVREFGHVDILINNARSSALGA